MSRLVEGQPVEAATEDPTAVAQEDEPASRHRKRRRWRGRVDAVLVGAVAVGGFLRVWRLGHQSLWYDEWLTGEAASGSFRDLLRYVLDQAGIPPAYFTFMWGWARVFGDGDAALRSVSALAGIAAMPLAYALARELRQRRAVARTAAALVAVNPMLVWYSQEARPYSLLALLAGLSVLLLVRLWAKGRLVDLAAWLLVCAATIAVHYFAVFLVAAEVAAFLVVRRSQLRHLLAPRWSRWRSLLAAAVPAGVVLAALAPFGVRQFSQRDNHSWITNTALARRLEDAGQVALVGPGSLNDRTWQVIAALVASAVLLLVVRGDRGERRAAAVVGAVAGLSVTFALGATVVGVDMVISRYFIVLLVPLIVGVAVGLGLSRVPRWVGATATAVVCAISLVTIVGVARDPDLQRSDWEAIADVHDAAPGTGEQTDDGPRLLVMNLHGYQGRPLLRYLDNGRVVGRDEEVIVDRIDFVVAKAMEGKPCNPFVGRHCILLFLGAPAPEPLASQLILDEQVELDQFYVNRFRTAEPVRVSTADLAPPSNVPRSLVLISE